MSNKSRAWALGPGSDQYEFGTNLKTRIKPQFRGGVFDLLAKEDLINDILLKLGIDPGEINVRVADKGPIIQGNNRHGGYFSPDKKEIVVNRFEPTPNERWTSKGQGTKTFLHEAIHAAEDKAGMYERMKTLAREGKLSGPGYQVAAHDIENWKGMEPSMQEKISRQITGNPIEYEEKVGEVKKQLFEKKYKPWGAAKEQTVPLKSNFKKFLPGLVANSSKVRALVDKGLLGVQMLPLLTGILGKVADPKFRKKSMMEQLYDLSGVPYGTSQDMVL